MVVERGFEELDLTAAVVRGSLHVQTPPPSLPRLPSEPASEPREIAAPCEPPTLPIVPRPIVHNRKFPDVFEGKDTTSLKEILRKRKILTTAENLLIDDGTGHIDRPRIHQKLMGVTPGRRASLESF